MNHLISIISLALPLLAALPVQAQDAPAHAVWRRVDPHVWELTGPAAQSALWRQDDPHWWTYIGPPPAIGLAPGKAPI